MRTFQEIAADYYRLESEFKQWVNTDLEPRLAQCSTPEDFRDVLSEFSLACADDTGQIRDLPFTLNIEIMLRKLAAVNR